MSDEEVVPNAVVTFRTLIGAAADEPWTRAGVENAATYLVDHVFDEVNRTTKSFRAFLARKVVEIDVAWADGTLTEQAPRSLLYKQLAEDELTSYLCGRHERVALLLELGARFASREAQVIGELRAVSDRELLTWMQGIFPIGYYPVVAQAVRLDPLTRWLAGTNPDEPRRVVEYLTRQVSPVYLVASAWFLAERLRISAPTSRDGWTRTP